MSNESQDWPPAVSARDFADGATKHGSTGQLFRASNGQWVRVDERKQKTVHVNCGASTGAVLRIYRNPIREGEPAMPDPECEPVTLRAGANPGIDAQFFSNWYDQNKTLAKSLNITAEDEDENPEGAKREE